MAQSPLVLGLGIESRARISSVLELVEIERMGSCSKSAMLLAAPEDSALSGAPAGSHDSATGGFGVEGVAASRVSAHASALEGVAGSL